MAEPMADPRDKHRTEKFEPQQQEQPGTSAATEPTPDHGEQSYRGSGRLAGRVALITGGDSGIGRAVAIAYAREGADVAITYMAKEQQDAREVAHWVEDAGQQCALYEGDLRDEDFCAEIVESTVEEFGALDIVVLNAAYQRNRESLETLETEEFERVFQTNLYSTLWVARAAIPQLSPGASIIVTSSIQAFEPSPNLIDYAMSKAALVAFTKALAQELGPKGIRVNAVAPGPIWTPLIPATDWPDKVAEFGQNTPLGRAGQPAELASSYVYLAEEDASYVTGAVIPVTGGKTL